MSGGVAHQNQGFAGRVERRGRHSVEVGDDPHRADRGGWLHRTAVGLVVERDVARDDRKVQRRAGRAEALDAADELPHHLGPLGAAEVEAIGHRERPGAGGGKISPRFGDRLGAPGLRIGGAVARRAVDGHRQPLVGAVHAHDRGVAARALHGIGHDHVIVLLPHPALGAEVGAGEQALEAAGEAFGLRHVGGRERGWRRDRRPRPLVPRRLVDQRRHGNVGGHLAGLLDHQAARVGERADDREIEPPFLENRARLRLAPALQHHQHALLAFGQHDLVSAHAALAPRHGVEVEGDPDAALVGHLHRRAGEPRGAHVLDGDNRVGGHQLETRLEQELFGERIADLYGRALGVAVVVELGRRHGRAVDAVAPRLRADVNHGVAHARRGGVEDSVLRRDAHGHGVDQDVAVVRGVEVALAADRGNADAIAVGADAGDHAGDQMAGLGVLGAAETQRVEVGHRARAHGEYVAQDAADARRRPLVGLDERRVVVALHLEHRGEAVADVDDSGVLARPANHPRRLGGQRLEPFPRRLVRTMLAPHHREDAELGDVGLAPEDLDRAVVLGRAQTHQVVGTGWCAAHPRAATRESNIALPSSPPRRGSASRSGWGIRPSTVPASL